MDKKRCNATVASEAMKIQGPKAIRSMSVRSYRDVQNRPAKDKMEEIGFGALRNYYSSNYCNYIGLKVRVDLDVRLPESIKFQFLPRSQSMIPDQEGHPSN